MGLLILALVVLAVPNAVSDNLGTAMVLLVLLSGMTVVLGTIGVTLSTGTAGNRAT